MKYLVSYYEDEYTCVHEVEIECEKEEIRDKVDQYYEKNLKDLEIAGANWNVIL